MTPLPDDPTLTAYALGELSADDAATVERAIAENPELHATIRETREIQQFLTARLTPPAEKLLPQQRENIRRSARTADTSGKIVSFWTRWLIPAAAAAVLALAAFIVIRTPRGEPTPVAVQIPPPVSIAPVAVLPISPPPPAPILPPAVPYGSVAVADSPTLELPIITGKPDLELISKSIRIDQQLPPRSAVRIEEILNAFPLRLNGVAAISRSATNNWHPDNRDSGMSAHVATLSTEMIACPWKPSATLLFISLRGNPRSACDVRMAYHANPDGVARYRILGFTPADGPLAASLPTKLAVDATTTLAIEIESSKPGGDLGSLVWSTDDQPAPSISLIYKKDAEPSDDARFATLVCTYAQWLAGEQPGVIHPEILSALARETASATLPTDRAKFLELIENSLHLTHPLLDLGLPSQVAPSDAE